MLFRSMRRAIDETERRRRIQAEHNQEHDITPATIIKAVRAVIEATKVAEVLPRYGKDQVKDMSPAERKKAIAEMEKEMKKAARELDFERAAQLRDLIIEVRKSS